MKNDLMSIEEKINGLQSRMDYLKDTIVSYKKIMDSNRHQQMSNGTSHEYRCALYVELLDMLGRYEKHHNELLEMKTYNKK